MTQIKLKHKHKLINIFYRLKEVIFSKDQLYLVFEFLEYDLKKYMKKIGTALPAD